MAEQIKLDTSSWDSIEDTIDKINSIGCMQFGTNTEGEAITLDVFQDDDGNDGLHMITNQSNGWERHNLYYPGDCTVEEYYSRGDR